MLAGPTLAILHDLLGEYRNGLDFASEDLLGVKILPTKILCNITDCNSVRPFPTNNHTVHYT